MSIIRVLSDQLVNQIAAGEVVERPASVAKELVENAIDAGARRIEVDVEAGGRRLLRVADDGCGMTRDDALLAFERHATSKIARAEDLDAIGTLGFRGEALASIASVARVELLTQTGDEPEATRVLIEGGRMRDVSAAARPRGTTLTVRDLFFNVPARRKFLRSEATESFHLTNLVTHYALAHPESAFVLTNNGRETLRAAPAADLRERAYQIFGAEFLSGLLPLNAGHAQVARVRGYVSAPRERRTTRDAQYLFVNGRFVRDRLLARALTEGYRTVLPHGVYPAALLFLDVPLEEVDVNVHPAKTEVRFRRAAAVADAVREGVRAALAAAGYLRRAAPAPEFDDAPARPTMRDSLADARDALTEAPARETDASDDARVATPARVAPRPRQEAIEFGFAPPPAEFALHEGRAATARGDERNGRHAPSVVESDTPSVVEPAAPENGASSRAEDEAGARAALPPLNSIAGALHAIPVAAVRHDIRPLYQLEESYIVAADGEGLLLIDQHAAHERVLFDKYRALEQARAPEAQQLLVPETFDLTPAQAAAFDAVAAELEAYGFGLLRLSGRTVGVGAVPADLPAAEVRNLLTEVLDAVDAERRGRTRETLRERVAASLACHAAVKVNMPLAYEKMCWLIDRLLLTSSPTTCPHGRPAVLRLATRDIERGFHRP
ncbi:MAG TPA: DNA mismatch repair endonuclease MutL [Pyrinomonadaceae bacterium]|jgi:DNA mismatch repair protein MutL